MKKKILGLISILMAGIMLFCLTGCSSKNPTSKSNSSINFDYSKINTASENIGKNAQVKSVLNEDIKPGSYEGIQFTGNTNDLNEANIQAGNLNWVILAEDENNYMLTTVKPTSDTIELQGADGYNNAV